ncbi:vascular endothelial growth factor receptor 1-like [Paramacrobiotus metropolitanus]|uniref:vascular endothelial growth factor receptor 1-like n=1 Tax=Paramacrobiotus metropolitanus TaxID=2943436 RepID=UPI0024458E06|nr:vascular endothelial growth factor receptor 1-like [Paramacrobiotus metropolitanus]
MSRLNLNTTDLRLNSMYQKFDLTLQNYMSTLEIPLASLEIGEILGEGEYGLVRKGTVKDFQGQSSPVPVAIKGVKDFDDLQQQNLLVQEMKIMTKAGRHLNIINLMGIVFKGEILLILEYCEYGSLLNYLQSHRGLYFYNQTSLYGEMDTFNDEEFMQMQGEANRVQQYLKSHDTSFDRNVMTTRDLLKFAFQISRGMRYLNSRSIIHRDLAARNVLVCQDRVVALPVRWMSPESIIQRLFNQKSDVWSFGVLMWELFSLGETPYANSSLDISNLLDFLSSLRNGTRMERPATCPVSIYSLMLSCWITAPEERPEFAQLEKELTTLIGNDSAEIYYSLDLPYQQFNLSQQNLLDHMHLSNTDDIDYIDTSDYHSFLVRMVPSEN